MATTLGQKKFYTLSVNEKKPDEFGDVLNTLEDVTTKGNYTAVPINFIKDNTDGSLGMNMTTYSMFFGNMNPSHTGLYNISIGYNVSSVLTTGAYNTVVGSASFKVATTAYKNTIIGRLGGRGIVTGGYNTLIGQMSGEGLLDAASKNTMIGANTSAYVSGNNNVFIGILAGRSNTTTITETVNNRLVIHSNVNSSTPNGTEVVSDLSSSWTNGLIIGDFADRWVKFNGNFSINPTHIPNAQGNALFTKQIVAKADGTFGWEDKIPLPPQTGNYKLISTNGVMSWVEEII